MIKFKGGDTLNELPKRKNVRLKYYDYDAAGCVFITVCTKNRECILSEISQRDLNDDDLWTESTCLNLTRYGEIVDKYIKQLNDFYSDVSVEHYVIMPNHIHFLLYVETSGRTSEDISTCEKGNDSIEKMVINDNKKTVISRFMSTFKRFCNKEIGYNIWQNRSYDHVIRNKRDFDEHVRYISENPVKWRFDNLFSEC